MTQPGAPEYVLVPDGAGGLRMVLAESVEPSDWDPDPVSLAFDDPPAPRRLGLRRELIVGLIGIGLLSVATAVILLRAPAQHRVPPPVQIAAIARQAAAPPQNAMVLRVSPAAPPEPPPTLAPTPPRKATAQAEAAPAAPAAPRATVAVSACHGTPAERLVCAEPQLADADRAMRQDLRAAERAGVSPDDLRLGQAEFDRRREAAARISPGALAEVYVERIEELDGQIADAPR